MEKNCFFILIPGCLRSVYTLLLVWHVGLKVFSALCFNDIAIFSGAYFVEGNSIFGKSVFLHSASFVLLFTLTGMCIVEIGHVFILAFFRSSFLFSACHFISPLITVGVVLGAHSMYVWKNKVAKKLCGFQMCSYVCSDKSSYMANNPIGVRFNAEKLELIKKNEKLSTPQQVVNFLLDEYWDAHKPPRTSPIIFSSPVEPDGGLEESLNIWKELSKKEKNSEPQIERSDRVESPDEAPSRPLKQIKKEVNPDLPPEGSNALFLRYGVKTYAELDKLKK